MRYNLLYWHYVEDLGCSNCLPPQANFFSLADTYVDNRSLKSVFSGAPKHLNNWLCPSVGRLVGQDHKRLTIHTVHLLGLLGLVQSNKTIYRSRIPSQERKNVTLQDRFRILKSLPTDGQMMGQWVIDRLTHPVGLTRITRLIIHFG